MVKYYKYSALLLFAVALLFSATAQAGLVKQDSENEAQAMLVPSPGPLFTALAKLGDVNLVDAASFNENFVYKDKYTRAMNLGIRAADAFLAIQAKDSDKLNEMISVMVSLARTFKVSDTIMNKAEMFQDLSAKKEWKKMLQELEILQSDILNELNVIEDQDLAVLMSAGGWLEGLRACSNVLLENYSPKGSSLLYQPKLVTFFQEELGKMGAGPKGNALVCEFNSITPDLLKLVDVGFKKPVPMDNIMKLNDISKKLVIKIEKGS